MYIQNKFGYHSSFSNLFNKLLQIDIIPSVKLIKFNLNFFMTFFTLLCLSDIALLSIQTINKIKFTFDKLAFIRYIKTKNIAEEKIQKKIKVQF